MGAGADEEMKVVDVEDGEEEEAAGAEGRPRRRACCRGCRCGCCSPRATTPRATSSLRCSASAATEVRTASARYSSLNRIG